MRTILHTVRGHNTDIRREKRARLAGLAALIMVCVLCVPAEAFAAGSLDRFVALDLIGGETGGPAEGTAVVPSGYLPEPGSGAFAEALAQETRMTGGRFELGSTARFFIASDASGGPDSDLTDTVMLSASEFAAAGIPSEQPLSIVFGDEELAEDGDIVIELDDEEDFRPGIITADIEQTYKLYIDERITVEACSAAGIRYGLTELLEIAVSDGERTDRGILLDRLRVRDGPDLKERAVMLDCGRKYFTKEWIMNFIRRASLQRYNALVLHFAEAEGVRLDSEVFPWLTEDIDSLSTEDMTEIVRLAHRYHVDIIPSFDTPGHNRYMVKKYRSYVKDHPDFSFTYDGRTYDSSIKGFGSIANHYSYKGDTEKADYIGIDLTKEHAVAFTNALIEGYADFFRQLGCDRIDIGSDELLGWYSLELGGRSFDYDNRWKALEHWKKYARKTLGIDRGSASDVLITYINSLSDRLEAMGYTCRVFNDDIDINSDQHIELKPSVEVTYWFDADNSAAHFAEKGHRMHNFMESWCFYVLRKDRGRDIMKGKYKSVNSRNIWENWNPCSFARKAGASDTVPEGMYAGGYFAVWCDHPGYKDQNTIWEETELRTWANASRMWNSEVNSDKSGIGGAISFDMMKTFAAGMGGFPGYTGDPGAAVSLPQAEEPAEMVTGMERLLRRIGISGRE